MSMSMTIQWSTVCVFLFETFQTQNILTYLVGCVVSGIFAALAVAMPIIKQRLSPGLKDHYSMILSKSEESIQTNMKDKLLLVLYYLLYSSVHIINMLLVMTMNAGVLSFILAGATLSYYVFLADKKCCN